MSHWFQTGPHAVVVVYCLLLSTVTLLALWKGRNGAP